jgi:hypothetical protein
VVASSFQPYQHEAIVYFGMGYLQMAKMNQQPPMHQLVILSTGWAAFFHSMLDGVRHSHFFLLLTIVFLFFRVCSWLFFPWT